MSNPIDPNNIPETFGVFRALVHDRDIKKFIQRRLPFLSESKRLAGYWTGTPMDESPRYVVSVTSMSGAIPSQDGWIGTSAQRLAPLPIFLYDHLSSTWLGNSSHRAHLKEFWSVTMDADELDPGVAPEAWIDGSHMHNVVRVGLAQWALDHAAGKYPSETMAKSYISSGITTSVPLSKTPPGLTVSLMPSRYGYKKP
jgi:hypothetical protein